VGDGGLTFRTARVAAAVDFGEYPSMADKPTVHMVSICGMGMAPLAVMLQEAGYDVRGSDKAAFPPMSDALAEAGIEIRIPFSPANLEPRPDLVIMGNAVTRANEEAVAVEASGVELLSFPQALSRFFLTDRRSLVVAGTHGKTTTTGMLAFALQTAGLDPGYLIGGRVRDLPRLATRGTGAFFVVEGDEYDTAYFDKGPKFLHYQPSAAIVTSVEFDHADIYRDVEHVKSSFRRFAEILPDGAPLVACSDYEHLRAAIEGAGSARRIWYGTGAEAEWSPRNLVAEGDGIAFDAYRGGACEQRVRLALCGEMNALNAIAVWALTRELDIDRAAVLDGLARYRGAARRQEIVGEARGITVVDDFAHHPTAVGATIAAMRTRWPERRLVAVFEPRSNTTRRAVFQQAYTEALAGADLVALSAVFAKENDPLAADEMLSTDRIVADLKAGGVGAWSADGPDEILARLMGELREGDVVLCMSNGAFGNLPRRLVAELAG
jgi:UDP-N-acetylmuramate: L-alanyl-gamma-D-glutamyl-meso-diaminopimelate ligase